MKVFLHIVFIIVLLALGIGSGYYFGHKIGYQKGVVVQKAIVNPVGEAADKAEEAKNPFKYENPFENVKTNPFE